MVDPRAWPGSDSSHDADVPAPSNAYQGGDPYADQAGEGGDLGNLYTELYGSPSVEHYGPDPYQDQYPQGHQRMIPGTEAPPPPREIPGDEPWRHGPRRRSLRRMRGRFSGTTMMAVGAAGLVLIVVVAIVLTYPGSNRASAPGAADSGRLPAPPPSVPPIEDDEANGGSRAPRIQLPTSPVLGRIQDPLADISYARLGGRWKRSSNDWMRDHGWPTGQSAIAMRNFNGDGDYLAGCYSGLLSKVIPYSGPEDLRVATERFASAVQKTADVYPQQHERDNIESRPFRVGARSAWLLRYELSFPQAREERWQFTKESVAMMVVDRGGKRRPGILFMTVPNSVKTQGDVAAVLKSVRSV